MEWAKLLIPIAATVLIGAASGLLSSVFVTARRLRSDLAVDLEILDRLPEDAAAGKQELSEGINRRTLLLVSYTRYPPLRRSEVFLLVGLVSFSGLATIVAAELGHPATDTTLVLVGVLSLAAASCWWQFFPRWGNRARDRLIYVLENIKSYPDWDDMLAGFNVGRFVATIGGAILVGVAPNWALIRVANNEDWAAGAITILVIVDIALFASAFWLGSRVERFDHTGLNALKKILEEREGSG